MHKLVPHEYSAKARITFPLRFAKSKKPPNFHLLAHQENPSRFHLHAGGRAAVKEGALQKLPSELQQMLLEPEMSQGPRKSRSGVLPCTAAAAAGSWAKPEPLGSRSVPA